jgi:hypothetical protein
MKMEFPRFAETPEGVFLDECLAFIRVANARSAILLAELEHIKKAIASEPQPDAGNKV